MRIKSPVEIPLIDREEERAHIQRRLENLLNGKGGALFIEGEVGVGKTRLIEEVFNSFEGQVKKVFVRLTRGEDPHISLMNEFLFSHMDRRRSEGIWVVGDEFDLEDYRKRYRRMGGVVVDVSVVKREGMETFRVEVSTLGAERIEAQSPEEVGNVLLHILRFNKGNVIIVWRDLTEAARLFTMTKIIRIVERIAREAEENGAVLLLQDSIEELRSLGIKQLRKVEGVEELPAGSRARRSEISPHFVLSVIKGAAERGPLFLILEDLHLSNMSFMNTVHFLIRELASEPVFFLGSYRVEEGMPAGSKEVVEILRRASRERLFDKLTLKGFNKKDFVKFVEALKPERDLDKEEMEALYRLSGGNPLLTWEMLRVQPPQKKLTLQLRAALGSIPMGLKALFTKSLTTLKSSQRDVLEVIAVLGENADVGFLKEVLGAVDEEEVLDNIESLIRLGYLKEDTTGRVGFVHEIFREDLYEAIPEERRKELHRRIAFVLLKREEWGDTRWEEAIMHLKKGGEHYYAMSQILKMCLRCIRRREYSRAVEMLQEVMDERPEEVPIEMWLQGAILFGIALYETGDLKRAEEWADKVVAMSHEQGWEWGEVEGELLKAYILRDYGKYDEAGVLLSRNLSRIERAEGESERAWRVYFHTGELLFYQGNLKGAREVISRYLQEVSRPTREAVEAHLILADIMRILTGDEKTVEVHLQKAREIARLLKDPELRLRTEVRILREKARLGRDKEVLQSKLEELFPRAVPEERRWGGEVALDIAEAAIALGRYDMARTVLESVGGLRGRERLRRAILNATMAMRGGRRKEIERAVKELERALEGVRIPVLEGQGYLMLAQAYNLLGKRKEAQRARRKSEGLLRRLRRIISTPGAGSAKFN